MTNLLSAIFGQPFAEAVAALATRIGNLVGTAKWDDLQKAQHEQAFVVAGAMKQALLADLAKAIDKAKTQGTTFETFKKDFRQIVQTHGWHGWTGEGTAKGEEWRMRVIFQTNLATSHAAGRMTQLMDGNFKFWVYRHGGSRDPRPQHLTWNGLALPPDHPFWETHAPPNGWGCTCYIVGTNTEAGIKRVHGDPAKTLPPGWDAIDPRTGAQVGIDKGWDYKVGASVAEDLLKALSK